MSKKTIHLLVDLREESTVKALRAEIEQLQKQIGALEERCRKAEFDLMFEFKVNEQLLELCKDNCIVVPRRLFQRI